MFDHIAVSYDGSAEARAGFDLATKLAASVGGRLTLVQAVESPYDALSRSSEPIAALEELIDEDTAVRVEELRATAATAPDDLAVAVEVLHGRAGPTLVEFIDRIDADLVVAGTRGMGLTRSLLGSVSRRLLEQTSADLLLLREPLAADRDPQVMACIDDSAFAGRAALVAAGLAEALSTGLVLTHVADSRLPLAQTPYAAVRSLIRQRGTEILAAAKAELDLPDGIVSEELREGDPREELLEACRERSPAIVVVGHHGGGRLRSVLLGSTARELVHRSHCPVLVVRAGDTNPEAAEPQR